MHSTDSLHPPSPKGLTRNIAHDKCYNLKPEWWDSPLVKEKCQEKKTVIREKITITTTLLGGWG
jgi:hypothetical protein